MAIPLSLHAVARKESQLEQIMQKKASIEVLPIQSTMHEVKGNAYSEDRELGNEGVDIARIERVYRYVVVSSHNKSTKYFLFAES